MRASRFGQKNPVATPSKTRAINMTGSIQSFEGNWTSRNSMKITTKTARLPAKDIRILRIRPILAATLPKSEVLTMYAIEAMAKDNPEKKLEPQYARMNMGTPIATSMLLDAMKKLCSAIKTNCDLMAGADASNDTGLLRKEAMFVHLAWYNCRILLDRAS